MADAQSEWKIVSPLRRRLEWWLCALHVRHTYIWDPFDDSITCCYCAKEQPRKRRG